MLYYGLDQTEEILWALVMGDGGVGAWKGQEGKQQGFHPFALENCPSLHNTLEKLRESFAFSCFADCWMPYHLNLDSGCPRKSSWDLLAPITPTGEFSKFGKLRLELSQYSMHRIVNRCPRSSFLDSCKHLPGHTTLCHIHIQKIHWTNPAAIKWRSVADPYCFQLFKLL